MNQEEEKKEEGRIKVYITFKEKTVLFSANPLYTLKVTMENVKKLSNMYPDKFWNLPEYDNNGQRITYYLGKQDSKSVFLSTAATGEDRSLEDYGVRAGDRLKIIQKVVAG
ncbi:MAG: hypothetical protein LBE56_00205 [Tannerella sp.]|jgi:hypothetical protein|nr:hypothetical protein [Tannerella sp.]